MKKFKKVIHEIKSNTQEISLKGFTLLELLVVLALIASVTTAGLASYSDFSDTQAFNSGVANFSNSISTARSRALSQVKPASCLNQKLQGYRVVVTVNSGNYELDAVCNDLPVVVTQENLPPKVTFTSSTVPFILFQSFTGISNQNSTVVITGFGKTKTIAVDTVGNITVN